MGYDIDLINKKTNKIVTNGKYEFKNIYDVTPASNLRVDFGGGGIGIIKELPLTEFSFNVTYNYGGLFSESIGHKNGIRYLYNKNVNEIIPILYKAITYLMSKYAHVFHKDIMGAEPDKKDTKYGQYIRPLKKPTKKQLLKQKDIVDDYWAITPYNVYKFLNYMLYCMCWVQNIYGPKKCENFCLVGD